MVDEGFLGGSVVKNLPANAGDMRHGSISGLGRSPREGNGNPHQNSCLGNPMDIVKTPLAMQKMQKTQVPSLGQEDYLEEGMATHLYLAWRTLWTEELDGLQSIWSQRVRHD